MFRTFSFWGIFGDIFRFQPLVLGGVVIVWQAEVPLVSKQGGQHKIMSSFCRTSWVWVYFWCKYQILRSFLWGVFFSARIFHGSRRLSADFSRFSPSCCPTSRSDAPNTAWNLTRRQASVKTHRIHVWYIYLHLVDFYGKCREIYHTWILWETTSDC